MKIVETRRKPLKIDENPMNIVGNPMQIVQYRRKSMKTVDNQRKSLKNHENRCKSNGNRMGIVEKRRKSNENQHRHTQDPGHLTQRRTATDTPSPDARCPSNVKKVGNTKISESEG